MKKSQHTQLAIPFEFPEPERKASFWQELFGYIPKPGELTRIDATVAYCEPLGRDAYCYCMRAKIIEINGYMARVETTKEYEEACNYAGSSSSVVTKAGTTWLVDVNNLAPIFETAH